MAAQTVYRVRAHNAATESENKIHHDDVAQRHGFRGGLVPADFFDEVQRILADYRSTHAAGRAPVGAQ